MQWFTASSTSSVLLPNSSGRRAWSRLRRKLGALRNSKKWICHFSSTFSEGSSAQRRLLESPTLSVKNAGISIGGSSAPGCCSTFSLPHFCSKCLGFQGAVGWVSERFVQLLEFTGAGSRFLFGDLVDLSKTGYIFCFQVLPTVVFFSALTAALYHLGILQKIVRAFAWMMVRVMRVSGVESLAAAANVFLGQTEAPLVVRPFINQLSRSGMLCLMAGGMATIAGAVLGAYVGFLGGDSSEEKAAFAKILLSASLMNAPAAIVLAKMLIPDEPGTVRDRRLKIDTEKQGSLLEAISEGTTTGLKLSLNIGAMLLVFVSLIALIDAILGGVGFVNSGFSWITGGRYEVLSLGALLSLVGAPVAWLIGTPQGDVLEIGGLLGTKLVANEFVAYLELADLKAQGSLSPKSLFLATFALCGFANFSSIGIQLGGIGGLAPEKATAYRIRSVEGAPRRHPRQPALSIHRGDVFRVDRPVFPGRATGRADLSELACLRY